MKQDNENAFNSAFLAFYFIFEILPTFLVVAFFRSSSTDDAAPGGASVAVANVGGAFGVIAAPSGAASTASTAPNTPRRAARALMGAVNEPLLDPTVTLMTPPGSYPASPSTPLLQGTGRGWNEAAHTSLLPHLNAAHTNGGVHSSLDDSLETLDLSHYDLEPPHR